MDGIQSMYIHIPFCQTICTYCDFCKLQYHSKWISEYLDALQKEMQMYYKGEKLSTIYIGGGTPNCLCDGEFERLLQIVCTVFHDKEYEYTIECNIELLTEYQISLMKKYGVNRVSLGVQTFQDKFLTFLNRHHTKKMVIDKVEMLRSYGISNINIDLMYAFPGETLADLMVDIDAILELGVPHISTYSLMIEPHTVLYHQGISPIDEEVDEAMYKFICDKFSHYNHYEISNFALLNFSSKHNLSYWNNAYYYGFGLGASGYIDGVRYTNTRSLTTYIGGKYRSEEHCLTKMETMENEMILGLRKLEGVSLSSFFTKYGVELEKVFSITDLLIHKQLLISLDYIKINSKYIYISNDILIHFIGCDSNE